MVKNRGIKSPQDSSAVAVILLAIIITALIAAFAIYYWQKANMESAEADLQNEIQMLKNKITTVQSKGNADTDQQVQPKIETISLADEFDANTQISFSKCGVAGAFRLEKWYPAFTEKLKTINTVPKNVSSACLSAGNEMLILIAQEGKYCEGPKVYRYNMKTSNLAPAEVLNKGVTCLGQLKEFGKREGNTIKAIAPGGDGGCRREEHYNYDFIKNSVGLIKSRSLCDGDKEWKWTEY